MRYATRWFLFEAVLLLWLVIGSSLNMFDIEHVFDFFKRFRFADFYQPCVMLWVRSVI